MLDRLPTLLAGRDPRALRTDGDTALAVREGIARTGRPITNAALIMIVVFIAFGVTGPIPPTELGVTLAFAVFLDATVVRRLLVPAVMAMLGQHDRWLPRRLDRRLPLIEFSHGGEAGSANDVQEADDVPRPGFESDKLPVRSGVTDGSAKDGHCFGPLDSLRLVPRPDAQGAPAVEVRPLR